MKKPLLFIFILFCGFANAQDPEIYLKRSNAFTAYVDSQPVDSACGLSVLKHRVFRINYTCINLGVNDLIIDTNTSKGIVPVKNTCPFYAWDTYIPCFVTLTLTDLCGRIVASDCKNIFALQNGDKAPYKYNSTTQRVEFYLFPFYEKDSMLRYGVPDTMIAFNEPIDYNQPYQQGITAGYEDTYANNKFGMDGVSDGVYYMNLTIHAGQGRFPRDMKMWVNIGGDSLKNGRIITKVKPYYNFETVDIVQPRFIDVTPAPKGKTQAPQTAFWAPADGACHYNLLIQKWFKGAWHPITGSTIKVNGTSYSLADLPSGMYMFAVSATNGTGDKEKTSAYISTDKVQIK